MERDQRVLQAFKELGIKSTAARAYLSLLKVGPSTAARIARVSGVPHPRSYDVMRYLERKGLIEVQRIGRRNLYRAVEPKTALNHLMANFASRRSYLLDSIEQQDRGIKAGLPDIWMIEGRNNIIGRLPEIIEKSEIDVVLAVSQDIFEKCLRSLTRAIERGVHVSAVLYGLPEQVKEKYDALEERMNIRCQMIGRRLSQSIMVIADYKYALFWRAPEDNMRGAFAGYGTEYATYAEDPGLLLVLDWYFFYMLWEQSEICSSAKTKSLRATHIWRATEEAHALLAKGEKVRAVVHGIDTDSGKRTKVESTVCKVSHGNPFYSLSLKKEDGEITVGGPFAQIEDIRAHIIRLDWNTKETK